jgi:hypothetical protein
MLLLLRLSFFLKRAPTPLLEVLLTHYFSSFLSSSRNQVRILEYLVKKVDSLCERIHDGFNLTAYDVGVAVHWETPGAHGK